MEILRQYYKDTMDLLSEYSPGAVVFDSFVPAAEKSEQQNDSLEI